MFYSSTKYDSLMDWVFSFGGIITIVLIILAIWLIYNYFKKKNDDGNNNEQLPKYYPSSKKTIYDNQYDTEFGNDESFWDDIKKTNSQEETNNYPTREEEPIPPNAIPPSSYIEDDVKIYEKKIETFVTEQIVNEEKENE